MEGLAPGIEEWSDQVIKNRKGRDISVCLFPARFNIAEPAAWRNESSALSRNEHKKLPLRWSTGELEEPQILGSL